MQESLCFNLILPPVCGKNYYKPPLSISLHQSGRTEKSILNRAPTALTIYIALTRQIIRYIAWLMHDSGHSIPHFPDRTIAYSLPTIRQMGTGLLHYLQTACCLKRPISGNPLLCLSQRHWPHKNNSTLTLHAWRPSIFNRSVIGKEYIHSKSIVGPHSIMMWQKRWIPVLRISAQLLSPGLQSCLRIRWILPSCRQVGTITKGIITENYLLPIKDGSRSSTLLPIMATRLLIWPGKRMKKDRL